MAESRACGTCGVLLAPGLSTVLCPRCSLQEVLASTEDQTPSGKHLGDYELIEEIARGGMGVVWRARQRSLNRTVALKMIRSGNFASKEDVLRFRAEAESTARLQHPHIVRIHETGEADGLPFFTMDYVPGANLAVLVRDRPLPAKRAVGYVKKIAEAIHYAHEHGILHRDLKPSNVLIDEEDNPRVTDFGLAKRVQKDSFITVTGQVLGSPSFMPPEQAGSKVKMGRHSDVYGLGAILYFLLTARAPFQGESVEVTLNQVRNDDPVSPRRLNPAVPLDLETICLKCLEKDPARRYADAHELALELNRFLCDEPIVARPIGYGEKLWRWGQRNPELAQAISAAVALFIVGFIISLWQWRRAEERAAAAQLNLYVSDMNLALQALRQNNHGYALEKLRAHLPGPGNSTDLRGWEWRYLWKRCQPNNLSSISGDKPVNALALTRNGALLASATEDGLVQVWDYPQSRVISRFTGSSYGPSQSCIAFSPDGALFAMVHGERVFLYETTGWELMRILNAAKPGNLFTVMFSPGNNNVLATGTAGLKAWEAASGREIRPPISFEQRCLHLALSIDGRWIGLSTGDGFSIWDLQSRTKILSRYMGPEQISALAFSSNGLFAACDRDGIVRVWDLLDLQRTQSTKPQAEWDTHSSTIYSAAFSPDNATLATAGSDQLIHLWSTENWQKLNTFKGHLNEVWSLAFASDGDVLLSGGKYGAIMSWNPRERPQSDALAGARFPLWFSPDSRTMATRNGGRNIQFWDVATRTLQSTLRPATNLAVEFAEMTPDGTRLLIRSASNVIHVIDTRNSESIGTLAVDATDLFLATPWRPSPDSRLVPVCIERRPEGRRTFSTELYDISTRGMAATVKDLKGPVCFSPDGRLLAGHNSSRKPIIWDVARGKILWRLEEIARGVTSLAFSGDGRLFAVGSVDGTARLWAVSTGRLLFTLKGHQQGLGKILFSRDNRTLFSTSTDDTVKLWNVATGQEMLSLTDYGGDTYELLLSPDDSTLAVGGLYFARLPIKLWTAPSLKEIDAQLKNQRVAD
jgi:eukaryotic-like serine/threonine-protein kinase